MNNKIQTKHYKVKIVKVKRSPFKFIISVISYALFIWLLLIGITLLIYVADMKIRESKGEYNPPKFNAFVVLTGSMIPQINVKDVVITKKIDSKELKKDDIITFISTDPRFEGVTITHRIVDVIPDLSTGEVSFKTKGDNNNVADSVLVKDNNILGKVIFRLPKIGYLQDFLATQDRKSVV